MSCIKKHIIQEYIDNEASLREIALIERHIKDCEICAQKIDHQRQLAADVKNALNLLGEEKKEIPTLDITGIPVVKRFVSRKKIIYAVSAACILLFTFIILPKEKVSETPPQKEMIPDRLPEIDANLPVTEQPIVIHIIDPKGNVTEYTLK